MWFKYFKIIFGETFDTGLDSIEQMEYLDNFLYVYATKYFI